LIVMDSPVAVVTGANRGIGLEIAAQLARRGMTVVLTAREARKGEAAAAALAAEQLAVSFHPLDVTRGEDASALADHVRRHFGRLDVLVNNAGVLLDPKGARALTLDLDVLRATLETNVIGLLAVTQALAPLLQASQHGRVVNLSSGLGQITDMGVGTPAYRLAKTAVNVLTILLAQELAPKGVKVNAMCPGWVRTAMGGPNATRSVAEGAETAVWLATLEDDGPTGKFFRDRQPIPW
jgi:NAD(P)-dependent dehydrogenase (short-subunit alcohol dehydrogenase family)